MILDELLRRIRHRTLHEIGRRNVRLEPGQAVLLHVLPDLPLPDTQRWLQFGTVRVVHVVART